jgi:hypothetical protein
MCELFERGIERLMFVVLSIFWAAMSCIYMFSGLFSEETDLNIIKGGICLILMYANMIIRELTDR